jgi:hypothetical protein
VDVLSINEDVLSNLEVWSWGSPAVHRALVLVLSFSYSFFELLMYLIEISNEFSCSCRGKVMLWVNGDVGMVALVGIER